MPQLDKPTNTFTWSLFRRSEVSLKSTTHVGDEPDSTVIRSRSKRTRTSPLRLFTSHHVRDTEDVRTCRHKGTASWGMQILFNLPPCSSANIVLQYSIIPLNIPTTWFTIYTSSKTRGDHKPSAEQKSVLRVLSTRLFIIKNALITNNFAPITLKVHAKSKKSSPAGQNCQKSKRF